MFYTILEHGLNRTAPGYEVLFFRYSKSPGILDGLATKVFLADQARFFARTIGLCTAHAARGLPRRLALSRLYWRCYYCNNGLDPQRVGCLNRDFCRASYGVIPVDGGNRGESTITELPTRNRQRQKHHIKYQTTANRMAVVRFFVLRSRDRGMATRGISPGEFENQFPW